MGATLGVVVAPVVKIEESRQRGSGLEPDAAAVTPVAAVGATIRHVLLAAEADAAGASVATFDEDIDLVDEHAVHRGPGRPGGGHTGLEPMLTKRESPRRSNFT